MTFLWKRLYVHVSRRTGLMLSKIFKGAGNCTLEHDLCSRLKVGFEQQQLWWMAPKVLETSFIHHFAARPSFHFRVSLPPLAFESAREAWELITSVELPRSMTAEVLGLFWVLEACWTLSKREEVIIKARRSGFMINLLQIISSFLYELRRESPASQRDYLLFCYCLRKEKISNLIYAASFWRKRRVHFQFWT